MATITKMHWHRRYIVRHKVVRCGLDFLFEGNFEDLQELTLIFRFKAGWPRLAERLLVVADFLPPTCQLTDVKKLL